MTKARAYRVLGTVLTLGAVYDFVFGVAILVFTRKSAALLGLSVPDDPIYLYLNGVFLLILAGVYGAAAREPERYPAIAPLSAAGRTLGFLLFVWAWAGGRPTAFLALGVADLAIAVLTAYVWRRAILLSA